MTLDEVVALLRRECDALGGQKRWADTHGVSAAYVNDVLQRRREPGHRILDGLGLEVCKVYVRKDVRNG